MCLHNIKDTPPPKEGVMWKFMGRLNSGKSFLSPYKYKIFPLMKWIISRKIYTENSCLHPNGSKKPRHDDGIHGFKYKKDLVEFIKNQYSYFNYGIVKCEYRHGIAEGEWEGYPCISARMVRIIKEVKR